MVAERELDTYPHSPWSGKGGVDVGGGGTWDQLSGLPHYCKVLCVPEWRWSELMSRCWTVAFN